MANPSECLIKGKVVNAFKKLNGLLTGSTSEVTFGVSADWVGVEIIMFIEIPPMIL